MPSSCDTLQLITVTEAIRRRSSVRRFIPQAVDSAVVREILTEASRAPSGGNLQPWQVYAVAGETLAAIKREVQAKYASGITEATEYNMYPPDLWEPLRARHQAAAARTDTPSTRSDRSRRAIPDSSARAA